MTATDIIKHVQGVLGKHKADKIDTLHSEFNGALSNADNNVHKALRTLDVTVGNLVERTLFKTAGSGYTITADDIDNYGGLEITTGSDDALVLPTTGFTADTGKRYTVINKNSSSHNVSIAGRVIEPGSGLTLTWNNTDKSWNVANDTQTSTEVLNNSTISGANVTEALDTTKSQIDDHESRITTAETNKAENIAVVHLSGDESISGVKTFSASPIVPETPTADGEVASKKYVDDKTAISSPVTAALIFG